MMMLCFAKFSIRNNRMSTCQVVPVIRMNWRANGLPVIDRQAHSDMGIYFNFQMTLCQLELSLRCWISSYAGQQRNDTINAVLLTN
jgi:hypothetical protein